MTNMNSSHQSLNNLPMVDVNDPEFYSTVQQEIDYDMARLKKNIIIITKLRMAAAEMEVETAALYHAELWYNIEEMKLNLEKSSID